MSLRNCWEKAKTQEDAALKIIPSPSLAALGSCVSSVWNMKICTWLCNSIEETTHHKCFQMGFSEMNRNTTCFVITWTHATASWPCFLTMSPASGKKNLSRKEHITLALFPLLLFKGICKLTHSSTAFYRSYHQLEQSTYLSQRPIGLTFAMQIIAYLVKAIAKNPQPSLQTHYHPKLPRWP